MRKIILTLLPILWFALSFANGENQIKAANIGSTNQVGVKPSKTNIITGADQTNKYLPYLKGKNVGMTINQTSTIGK